MNGDVISTGQAAVLMIAVTCFIYETLSLLAKDEFRRSCGRIAGGIWRLIAGSELFVLTHCWQAIPVTYYVPGNVLIDANFVIGVLLVAGLVTVGSGINKLRNYFKSKS